MKEENSFQMINVTFYKYIWMFLESSMGEGELTWNQLWEIWQHGSEIFICSSCYNYLTCIIRI